MKDLCSWVTAMFFMTAEQKENAQSETSAMKASRADAILFRSVGILRFAGISKSSVFGISMGFKWTLLFGVRSRN